MKAHVLVVDDELGIGNILRIKFRLSGYDVTVAMSGAEGIEAIRSRKPDIVLLDMLMPGLTGMDVLKQVRAFSHVPIIVFTAKPDIIGEALKNGANDSISKPFNPDELVKKIAAVLDSARQKQRDAA